MKGRVKGVESENLDTRARKKGKMSGRAREEDVPVLTDGSPKCARIR
jgi:hypothetical protein